MSTGTHDSAGPIDASLDQFRTFCRNSLAANDVDPGVEWLRYMVNRMEMNREQVLWLCLLYGITYHLPSAYLIWSEFPDLEILDPERLRAFWAKEQHRIPFQTDKMKQRRSLPDTVESYRALVGASQVDYFTDLLDSHDEHRNFNTLWSPSKGLAYFGRFSIWNWAQMLREVAGLPISPPSLLLGEPDSRSFTDGLAHAFGVPERAEKGYRWAEGQKAEMEAACATLRADLGIDNFQLETLACAYKKVWRTHDSRYVGYYTDRLTEDLRKLEAEPRWSGVDWSLMWDARAACTPTPYLNPGVDKALFTAPPSLKIGAGHMKRSTTRSVYIIGGAATGKSTFMDALVGGALGAEFGSYGPLYTGKEASTGRARTLCGHRLYVPGVAEPGVYIGQHREWFPGTDGLDLVISPTAAEYLRVGDLPSIIVAEGAVLSTPKFLTALHQETNLLLLHLRAPDDVVVERVAQRGSANHNAEFLLRTKTRASNTLATMRKAGVAWMSIDTTEPEDIEDALDLCRAHLLPRI